MLYKTQGIIIKKENLGEFDRLLTVYTKDFGKLLLRAKAVRKNQAKLRGHLELFLKSHFMIAPSRGFDIITGAETIESFPYLHKNLSSLAAAFYLSELTDKLVVGPEKDENIWRLLLESFKELDFKEPAIEQTALDFGREILGLLGYGRVPVGISRFIRSSLGEEIKSNLFLQKVVKGVL